MWKPVNKFVVAIISPDMIVCYKLVSIVARMRLETAECCHVVLKQIGNRSNGFSGGVEWENVTKKEESSG